MRKFPVLLVIPLCLLIVGLAPPPPEYPLPATSVYATPVSPTPVTAPAPVDPEAPDQGEVGKWLGQYYNNRTLDGAPAGEREDDCLDFNWQADSAWPGRVGADNFSARWTKTVYFEPGFYQFYILTDDGARFFIDNTLIIGDAWKDQPPTQYSNGIQLQGGNNQLKVEYYEHVGGAQVKLWWEKRGDYPNWKAEYFKYHGRPRFCEGPVLVRNETAISHDWGTGSPSSALGGDFWAARWTGTPRFVGGLTRFFTRSDDGVRLWVDANDNGSFDDAGELVIDKWVDQSVTIWSGDIFVSPGSHRVKLEYYELVGDAVVQVWWRNW